MLLGTNAWIVVLWEPTLLSILTKGDHADTVLHIWIISWIEKGMGVCVKVGSPWKMEFVNRVPLSLKTFSPLTSLPPSSPSPPPLQLFKLPPRRHSYHPSSLKPLQKSYLQANPKYHPKYPHKYPHKGLQKCRHRTSLDLLFQQQPNRLESTR